jgi:hypothetical protein
MKLSELVKHLEKALEVEGDLVVRFSDEEEDKVVGGAITVDDEDGQKYLLITDDEELDALS